MPEKTQTEDQAPTPQAIANDSSDSQKPQPTQADHASNLRTARKESLKKSAQKAKQNIKGALNVATLMAQINPFIDWLFGIALILAILKDILDIVNTALIAAGGVGWLLIIIFTFFISVLIFLIMVITGSAGKTSIAKGWIKRILLVIGTAFTEIIPGVDLFPFETVLVCIIFWMTLRERRKGAKENKNDFI